MKYLVRKSTDFSVLVDANSPEEAAKIAKKIPNDEWGAEHSELEVEEYE